MRQSFRFKFFGGKKLKRLHAVIDVAAEIWNRAVALKNRYYKLFGKGLPKAKLQAKPTGSTSPAASSAMVKIRRLPFDF